MIVLFQFGAMGDFTKRILKYIRKENAVDNNNRGTESDILCNVFDNVRKSIVAIGILDQKENALTNYGTGVCVDPTGVIATSKSVIDSLKKDLPKDRYWISFANRIEEKLEVDFYQNVKSAYVENYDLELVRLPPKQEQPLSYPAIKLPEIPIGPFEMDKAGQRIAASGYPFGILKTTSLFPSLFSGVISRVDSRKTEKGVWTIDNLVMDVKIHKGNWGGPVFDSITGELLGIITSQEFRRAIIGDSVTTQNIENLKVWTNLVNCIPWTIVVQALEQNKDKLQIT